MNRIALDETVAVLRTYAATVDRDARFPTESLAAVRAAGLLALAVPPEFGGPGHDLHTFVDVGMELAGACLSTALAWSMHCQQVDALVRYAPPSLRARLLPRIARGEVYIASVTTERVKGGHLLTAHSPLHAEGDLLRIERDAPVVTGASVADGFLITMRAAPDAPPQSVSLVYADRGDLKVTETGDWDTLGMRGTHSVGVELSGQVSADSLIGGVGGFRPVAVECMIPLAHLGWSACWLGAARGALRDIVAELRQPGARWADTSSDLVRERLARIRVDLELVHGYLRRVCDEVIDARAAGSSLDTPATQIHLNTLKVAAAEMTFRAADRMIQFAGLARGYTRSSPLPLERVFRDLRSASLNYADDRLLTAIGSLALLDRTVALA